MKFKTSTQEYRDAHACCPKCGSISIESTTMGIGGSVDNNGAYCRKCKWSGTVHDLVSIASRIEHIVTLLEQKDTN